jgi:ATP-dependent RNA helicase DeaD
MKINGHPVEVKLYKGSDRREKPFRRDSGRPDRKKSGFRGRQKAEFSGEYIPNRKKRLKKRH